jgi:hypothetical protein
MCDGHQCEEGGGWAMTRTAAARPCLHEGRVGDEDRAAGRGSRGPVAKPQGPSGRARVQRAGGWAMTGLYVGVEAGQWCAWAVVG